MRFNYFYLAVLGFYALGCAKPNHEKRQENIEEVIVDASKPVEHKKTELSDIVKEDNKHYIKPKEKEIDELGTKLSTIYAKTPKFNIRGYYDIIEEKRGIIIENGDNEVEIVKENSSKNISEIIVKHKKNPVGIAYIKNDGKQKSWVLGTIKLNLSSEQISLLFETSERNYAPYFRMLEIDIQNAMPEMQRRYESSLRNAEEKFNGAIDLLGR